MLKLQRNDFSPTADTGEVCALPYGALPGLNLRNSLLIAIIVLIFGILPVSAQSSSLVYLGTGQKLQYATYANQGQTNAVNRVPDFSLAGYKMGGVPIPFVPVKEVVNPVSGDAKAVIQSAIDRVSALPVDANGLRGAVLIKSGSYNISGTIYIRASGVVIRGEGQKLPVNGGTELIATASTQHDFIQFIGTEVNLLPSAPVKRITTPYLPTGALTFEVVNTTGLAPGDTIKLTRTPNDNWINTLDMAQYGWTASEYKISYERIIKSINGNTLGVNAPVVQAIEDGFGGGEIAKSSIIGRLTNCGIENIVLSSAYQTDTSENHGWTAVLLSKTSDCWVRNVTARYFGYSCVELSYANFTTIEECAMLDPKSVITGSRRYSFNIDKGSFNLFQRCYTRGGRHDYVTGSRVAGPNVFVDCMSQQTYADIGPHHRYATGLLFDNVRGGQIRVQDRGASGTGHGWAGAQSLFWNCVSDESDFKVESPVGAMNWGIGCKGLVQNGAGFWESWGVHVNPRSLYYQQLKDRLGDAAVETVTIPEQRNGNIWTLLTQWGGFGKLSNLTAAEEKFASRGKSFELFDNFPNPFISETMISFSVDEGGAVSLKIYDALGQEIETVADEYLEAGRHSFKINLKKANSPGGVYFYTLKAGSNLASGKMLYLR